MPELTTMADIAREAGVSLMTVSRVVNDKEGVSSDTRRRVQEVIERLGYRPSAVARGLANRRTGTLGLVVPDNANPFFSEVARGAEHMAYAEGYSVFLCNTEEDVGRELDVLGSLEEKMVEGVLMCSPRSKRDELDVAVGSHPAAVLVNRRPGKAAAGSVMIDDYYGGNLAMQHLLDRGHRMIGMLAGPPASFSSQQRVQSYRDGFDARGIPYNPEWLQFCPPMVEGGMHAAQEMLTNHPELTALFCYNDLVAVGALQACASLGLTVPGDISVTGYDDIPLAALVTPPLTTCHVPRYELGQQAMQMLLDRIRGCEEECQEILLQPQLIIRASAP